MGVSYSVLTRVSYNVAYNVHCRTRLLFGVSFKGTPLKAAILI